MKRFGYLAVIATLVLTACEDFQDITSERLSTYLMWIESDYLYFDSDTESQKIEIKSNSKWNVSSFPNWIRVSPSSGKGNTTVTISVLKNDGKEDREHALVFSCEGGIEPDSVVVRQDIPSSSLSFIVSGNGMTVSFKMKRVEKGSFTMGEVGYNNTHRVTLTKDYYMGETEVTQALWYAVMGQSPISDGSSWSSYYGIGDNYPAYYISYEDCQKFFTKLNNMTETQLPEGMSFQFPTEAEWEFAAKGGNKSKNYDFSGSKTLSAVGWYKVNSNDKIHIVKGLKANELGIYDMSGNVREWCYDWDGAYSSSAQTDPTGSGTGYYRIYRGGSWESSLAECQCYDRDGGSPTSRRDDLGVRLALSSYQL